MVLVWDNIFTKLCQLCSQEVCRGPQTVEKLLHCFYVDDKLLSVATEKETVMLYQNLVYLCSTGFSLTKWLSNRPGVLEAIPESSSAKAMEGLKLELDSLLVERVLIRSDSFKFRITEKDQPLTRRGILSTVSSVCDPLGMLSPVVLTAEIIPTEVC